jgi:hypothetical protein
MSYRDIDRFASLEAYPSIRLAADIIGVSPSTLSRRNDLDAERRGERDLVLRPSKVLRLASIYRKRTLNDVAQDLIETARKISSSDAAQVEQEVEAFFEGLEISEENRLEFLLIARRLLPPALYKKVEEATNGNGAQLPDALIGNPPLPTS